MYTFVPGQISPEFQWWLVTSLCKRNYNFPIASVFYILSFLSPAKTFPLIPLLLRFFQLPLVKTHAQNLSAVKLDFINQFLLFTGFFTPSRNYSRFVRHDSPGSVVFQYIILTHMPCNFILHNSFSKSAHYQQQAYWLIVYKHCLEIFLEVDIIHVVFQFKGTRGEFK